MDGARCVTRVGTATWPLVLVVACAAPREAPPASLPVPAIAWAPRGYVCRRTSVPPSIDGRLDEAAWRAAPATEPFLDIEGPSRPAPRFGTTAKLLWDDRFLYVAAEMEEPDVSGTLTARDAVIFHDNDFEVFLDPDGDAENYFEIEINALGTVWDLFLPRAYRDGGTARNEWHASGLRSAVHVEGTLNRPQDRDRGWTVEMAIPWADLAAEAGRRTPPAPGDRWRINFSRVEWRYETPDGTRRKVADPATGKPLREDNWVWSPQGLVDMHFPEMWGFLQFSGLEAGAGEEPLRAPDDAERAGWDALLRRAAAPPDR
jgi:hypothetical protein